MATARFAATQTSGFAGGGLLTEPSPRAYFESERLITRERRLAGDFDFGHGFGTPEVPEKDPSGSGFSYTARLETSSQ
jgi:hypothetical protein